MILGQPYGRGIDIWVCAAHAQRPCLIPSQALGVLTYELICGEEPFAADRSQGTRRETYVVFRH